MGKSAKRTHDQVSQTPNAATTAPALATPKAAEVISSKGKQGQGDDGATEKQKKPVARVLFRHGISGIERSSKIDISKDLKAISSKVAAKLGFPPDADVRLVQVREGGREAEIWDDFDFDAFRNRALANPSQRLVVKVYPAAGPSTAATVTYPPSAYRTPQSQSVARPVQKSSTPTPTSLSAKSTTSIPRTPSNGNQGTASEANTGRSGTMSQANETGVGVSPGGEGISNRKMRRLQARHSIGEEGIPLSEPAASPNQNQQTHPSVGPSTTPPSSIKKDKKKKQRKKKKDQPTTPLSSPSNSRPAPTPPIAASIGKRKRSASPVPPSLPATSNSSAIPPAEVLTDETTSGQPKKKKKKDKSLPVPEQGSSTTSSSPKSVPPEAVLPPKKTGRPSHLPKAHYQPARPSPLGQFSTSAVNEGNAASSESPSIVIAPTPPRTTGVAVEVPPQSDTETAPSPPKKRAKKRDSTKPVMPEVPHAATSEVPSVTQPSAATPSIPSPTNTKPKGPNKARASSITTAPKLPQSPIPPSAFEPESSSAAPHTTVQPLSSREEPANATGVITSDPSMSSGKSKVGRIAKPKAKQESPRALLSMAIMAEFRALKAAEEAKKSAAVQALTRKVGAIPSVNAAVLEASTNESATVTENDHSVSIPETIASTPVKGKRKGEGKISTGEPSAAGPATPDPLTTAPEPTTPGEALTKRGRKSVPLKSTEPNGVQEKKGKTKEVQIATDKEVANTPVPPAIGNDESPVAGPTPAAEKVRKRKKAMTNTTAETAAAQPAGQAGDAVTSIPTPTLESEGVQAAPTVDPLSLAAEAVAEDIVPPTTNGISSGPPQLPPPQNQPEATSQPVPTPQTPVVSKRAKKDKEKKGKETASSNVDPSSSTITPATAPMDHPTPVAEVESVDADIIDRPPSPRIAASVELDETPEAAPRATQSTATADKPTTTAVKGRTTSTEGVPLIIQPISNPSPASSAKPIRKPSAKAQKYVKPPPLPRGESVRPEKPTCLICGVVVSHMQKNCTVVIAGIDPLRERLEVVKNTPKSRDRTLALETIEGWVKRLEEIKKRREALEAAQADAERDVGNEDSEEEEEDEASKMEEDEMYAPPSPSTSEPAQPRPTTSPVEPGIAGADEEEATTSETDFAPHPPMIGNDTRSSPLVEHSPLPNQAALSPLPPIPSVSARPRSESSSSSASSATSDSASSRSSADSSEAIKTPNTAQPVSADPSLPAIFLRGLKKHRRPGSTSAVSVSTAFIETEDSDSASGSESISESGEEQEQDSESDQDRLPDDEEMEGEADEDEGMDEDEGLPGQASALADSAMNEDDDMDGDDEADDVSQTTSRAIGRLALPRHGTASQNATSASPVSRSVDTARRVNRTKSPAKPSPPTKKPSPAPESSDGESDSDNASSDTSSPRSSLLPYVPSPTLRPATAQPATTAELPDAETMFKQFFSRPLSQRERAKIKAASQGQQSVSLRPDVNEEDDEEDDVESASEAPIPPGGDDASSIGDFGSVAGGDRDDSIEAEEGDGRVVQPDLAHAEDDVNEGSDRSSAGAEDEAPEKQDEDGDDGEGDEDDEIRSDRTSVPPERGITEQDKDSAPDADMIDDPIESESPNNPIASQSGPNGAEPESIPELPLSQVDESLLSQQSLRSRRPSQRPTIPITYSRRSARFKQLDDTGGESEAIDEFAGSVALAEARAEEATPEPLSVGSQPNGNSLLSEDDAQTTPKARGRKMTRSVSSSQPMTDSSQQTDTPNASLPNESLTRRRSSRLKSAEVEVVVAVPPSRQRRASTHSQASQNGVSASQRASKAPLDVLVEDSDELAQNGTPKAVRSSQVDQLDSSQPPEAPSQPVTPPTQKDRTIPATPTSRKVGKTLPPSSPATSARSTRSTSRSRAQSPLFMSQSQPLATQAYIARPQSLASSSPSLHTPVNKKAGKRGKKGEKVVTSPIVEEEEEDEADAELETPKMKGETQRDPLSSPSASVDNAREQPEEEEEEEEEQEYFSQADLPATSDRHDASPFKLHGGQAISAIPGEAEIDSDDNEDEAASSVAFPPILSRPVVPSSQPPPQSQMSFAPSLSSLPMDLLRSGVTAFAAFTGIGSQPVPKGPNGSSQSLIRDLDLGAGDEEDEESESGSGESSSDDDETPVGRGRNNGKGGKGGLRGRYVQSEKEKEAAKKRRARPMGW